MAIQPIDLSVVYSQMDNVAKFNASQNQLAQVANQTGRDRTAAENLEKSKTVQETAQHDAEADTIKSNVEDGGSSSGFIAGGKKKKKEDSEEEPELEQEISDPALGRFIDITG